jgi:isocitrate lyase
MKGVESMSGQHDVFNNEDGSKKFYLNGRSHLAAELEAEWRGNLRWRGITRPYSAVDVIRLRGSIQIEYTLARLGADRLWNLLHCEPYVAALGALTGNQAVQQVKAGLKAIYLSGWQVAADANLAGQMYPDQSLYPCNSVPSVVQKINQALQRADQIQSSEGNGKTYWFAPIVADGEAGFGGQLNVFEMMKAMIEAGAAGVHFEDQLSSEKKCGHMGGKVLIPTQSAIKHLVSARLAADVMGVPTLIIARTDANGTHTGRLLSNARRVELRHRTRPFLRAILRSHLVRDLRTELARSAALCRRHSRTLSRQDAGLQLLSLVQLEEKAG